MKLVFFGTGEFAVPILRQLADSVSLVVTQPDRPTGRGLRLQPSPLKLVAQELGLAVETPEKSRSAEFVERLRREQADALVVASYGQILSTAVLESAVRGGINLHGSLLPAYRGAAPIQRAILAGDTETGVTLMQMDRGMDTGDMIHVERLAIDPDETYGQLQDRLAALAAQMARDWMPKIVVGDYVRTPQDSALATIAPKITKEEAELKFTEAASDAYNRFRAFTPSPGAFLMSRFGRIRVTQCRRSTDSGAPGSLVAPGCVAFREGSIVLEEIQPEGKKRMSMRDFANGMRLRPGDSLLHP